MFTKKSLIVGITLVLTILCAGTMGAFASSVTTTTPPHTTNLYASDGIAAIPSDNPDEILPEKAIQHYLESQGFIAGTTIDGNAPTVQSLGLTNLDKLKKLTNLVIPGALGNKQVYYTTLKGPFVLNRDLPLPVVSTLLPSANNILVLSHLPLLGELTDLGGLPVLGNLANGPDKAALDDLPILRNLTEGDLLKNLQDLSKDDAPKGSKVPAISTGPDLEVVYEVFDAHNGNLLAWG